MNNNTIKINHIVIEGTARFVQELQFKSELGCNLVTRYAPCDISSVLKLVAEGTHELTVEAQIEVCKTFEKYCSPIYRSFDRRRLISTEDIQSEIKYEIDWKDDLGYYEEVLTGEDDTKCNYPEYFGYDFEEVVKVVAVGAHRMTRAVQVDVCKFYYEELSKGRITLDN